MTVRVLRVVVIMALVSAKSPPPSRAVTDTAARGIGVAFAAERLGVSGDMLLVAGEGVVHPWNSPRGYYHLTVTDPVTANYDEVWVDLETGQPMGRGGIEAVTAPDRERLGKYTAYVKARLEGMGPEEELTVALFVAAPEPLSAAEQLLREEPDARLDGDYPASDDAAENDRLEQRLRAIRREQIAVAMAPVLERARSIGLRVEFAATLAPMTWVTGRRDDVEAIAADWSVLHVLGSFPTELAITSAMQTDGADHAHDLNRDGRALGSSSTAAKIAVVEYDNTNWSDPDLSCIPTSRRTSLSYSGTGVANHPTWVMGAIAAQCGSGTGVAPGAIYVSVRAGRPANLEQRDYNVIGAVELAVNYAPYADIINLSLVADTGQFGLGGGGRRASHGGLPRQLGR
jgi:hypothetical protein